MKLLKSETLRLSKIKGAPVVKLEFKLLDKKRVVVFLVNISDKKTQVVLHLEFSSRAEAEEEYEKGIKMFKITGWKK